MAHNFKLTGDYYVSVDGSDSNSGLTKDAPKRTIQAMFTAGGSTFRNYIIGAGVYQENISTSANGNIFADGLVILQPTSPNVTTYSHNSGGSSSTYYDVIFRDYGSILFSNFSTGQKFFNRCSFFRTTITSNHGNIFSYCRFINTIISGSGGFQTQFSYSTLINSTLATGANFNYILNSYFNANSVIQVGSGIIAPNFNYNNIQGSIIMNVATTVTTGTYQDIYGRYYDLSQAGSNPSGNGSLAQPFYRAQTSGVPFSYINHRILYPTYNANSISVDPKFNNIEAQDFTLQADSPHIGRASDGINNIGGTKYAIRHAADGDAFDTSAVSVTDLDFIGSNYRVTSPATNGEVISSPILFSNTQKVLQLVRYNGLLEFNKAVGGAGTGVTGNRNVPDNYIYDSTTQPPDVAGANPDRLVYELRFSTQVAEPTIDAEWDNDGLWTAGNYGVFEWNTKPSVDTSGVGNGDPTFNAADTPTYLNVTWIQLKVKLRNNY